MKTVAQQIVNLLVRKTNEHQLIWQAAEECSYAAGYLAWIYRLEWQQYAAPMTLIVKNHGASGLLEYDIPDKRIRILRLRAAMIRQQLRLKGGEYSRAVGTFRIVTYETDDHYGALVSALMGLGGHFPLPLLGEVPHGHH